VCLGFAASSCFIAILFQKVNSYFGLLGGTAGVMMAGGIPALCYVKMMKCKRNDFIMLGYIAVLTVFAVSGAILSVADP
jgi:asparagine N-glycosylation enzyme membrane subunit Stt3